MSDEISKELSAAVADLPRLRVEDVQAMSEEEWEAFFESAVATETTYLFEENGEPTDVVMIPFTVFTRLVQAAGLPLPDVSPDAPSP